MMDSTTSPQIISHQSASLNYTPFDVRWLPMTAKLAVVGSTPSGKGVVDVMEMSSITNSNELVRIRTIQHDHSIKCCTFGAASLQTRQLAIGDAKGQLSIIDLETSKPSFKVAGHLSMISALDGVGGLNIGGSPPEIATASKEAVRVWDPRSNEPVMTMEPSGNESRDCWALAFGNSLQNGDRYLAAGYDNGDIKLLDLKTSKLIWETNIRNGVVSLQFDRKDIPMNKLVATSLEGKCFVFDMRTRHPTDGYSYLVHQSQNATVWIGKHLPQNREIFATSCGAGLLSLYRYVYPAQRSIIDADNKPKGVPGTLETLNSKKLAEQPIVGFDWNMDKAGLACMCSLDQHVQVAFVTRLNQI